MHTTDNTKRHLEPEFFKREVVIDETDKRTVFGSQGYVEGKIAYLGKKIKEEGNYKVGDSILYDSSTGIVLKDFFEGRVLRKLGDDTFVFCKLKEVDGGS